VLIGDAKFAHVFLRMAFNLIQVEAEIDGFDAAHFQVNSLAAAAVAHDSASGLLSCGKAKRVLPPDLLQVGLIKRAVWAWHHHVTRHVP
jgi:hypothetical protein